MTILLPAIEFRIFFESAPSTIAAALSHFLGKVECPRWVKMRKALYEQMLSELHPITDIERRRRQRTNS